MKQIVTALVALLFSTVAAAHDSSVNQLRYGTGYYACDGTQHNDSILMTDVNGNVVDAYLRKITITIIGGSNPDAQHGTVTVSQDHADPDQQYLWAAVVGRQMSTQVDFDPPVRVPFENGIIAQAVAIEWNCHPTSSAPAEGRYAIVVFYYE